MRVLFIGDIVGKPGREQVAQHVPALKRDHGVGLTIANAENAAAGFGITPSVAGELFDLGIDILTSGNHIWDKKEAEGFIGGERRLLRPANYPEDVPGAGVALWERDGLRVGILNLQGRVFLPSIDCPFRAADRHLLSLREATPVIVVDFHAEATSEKQAFAHYVDGRVSAVLGTHTHVQTADEQILPRGTAYITDVGMTGPRHSVIGIVPEEAIRRFLTQMPTRFSVATGPAGIFSGVLLDLDEQTGRARAITRLML